MILPINPYARLKARESGKLLAQRDRTLPRSEYEWHVLDMQALVESHASRRWSRVPGLSVEQTYDLDKIKNLTKDVKFTLKVWVLAYPFGVTVGIILFGIVSALLAIGAWLGS